MPKNETPTSDDDDPNYKTFPHVKKQIESDSIDISDHHVEPISFSSGSTNTEDNIHTSTSHIVVDLSSGCAEDAKTTNAKGKEQPVIDIDCGNQELIPEVVFEEIVTPLISVRRIGPYTSAQRILLVGEGDFSFSASLAVAFGASAANITATSLNTKSTYWFYINYSGLIFNHFKLTLSPSYNILPLNLNVFLFRILTLLIMEQILMNYF